jgi:hypothetical protein
LAPIFTGFLQDPKFFAFSTEEAATFVSRKSTPRRPPAATAAHFTREWRWNAGC